MGARAMAVNVIRIASGAGLMAMGTFWTFLSIKLVSGFTTGGADGARGNLHRVLLGNYLWDQTLQDPLVAISRGYEILIFGVLITWALREIHLYARKRTTRNKIE